MISDFDISDLEETEDSDVRQAWCASCDTVVDADTNGCIPCRDDGSHSQAETVVVERLAPDSPRNIECDTCGADPGKPCHGEADDTIEGYNHAARARDWAEQNEPRKVAAPRGRT